MTQLKFELKSEFNDDMTSTSLEGFFDDGILDSLRLSGMATTVYHLFEDSLYKGKNVTSGDTIIMNFKKKGMKVLGIDPAKKPCLQKAWVVLLILVVEKVDVL